MELDRNLKLAGSFLSFALISGCAREPEVASTLGNDANTTAEMLKDDERTDLSKLVLVAMQTQESKTAIDLKNVILEIAGTRLNGSTLVRLKDLRSLADGDSSVANELATKLLNNLHVIQITSAGQIELIDATRPREIVVAMGKITNNDLTAFTEENRINPTLIEKIVIQLDEYYTGPNFKEIQRHKGWKPKDPFMILQSIDKYEAEVQAKVKAENSSILTSRRALGEKDSGVIMRKSEDGLMLYLDIGKITVMSRAAFIESIKNQPPKMMGAHDVHKVAFFGDNQRIDIDNSYLKVSESLVIVAGELRLLKADAFVDANGNLAVSPGQPRLIKSAPFPEFTPAVIAKTEVGKIISNRKLLQRIHDFICETKQEEAKLMGTPPTSE